MNDFNLVPSAFAVKQTKASAFSCPADFEGGTKLCFMHHLRVVITLFSTGLYKSAFYTYSFGRIRFSSFCVLVFRVSVCLAFRF